MEFKLDWTSVILTDHKQFRQTSLMLNLQLNELRNRLWLSSNKRTLMKYQIYLLYMKYIKSIQQNQIKVREKKLIFLELNLDQKSKILLFQKWQANESIHNKLQMTSISFLLNWWMSCQKENKPSFIIPVMNEWSTQSLDDDMKEI